VRPYLKNNQASTSKRKVLSSNPNDAKLIN
jgi:hypothetical protein